jgi:Holliday junction resolvase RusA-like endonuclease
MSDLTLTIGWQPQSQVSPNTRNSSRNKSDHHRSNAGIAVLAVRSHMARESEPWLCPVHPALDITVYWGKGRNRQDLDNIIAGAKGIIDGVTRELGFDDRRLVAITVAQGRDPDGLGFTLVRIRPATYEERKRAAA